MLIPAAPAKPATLTQQMLGILKMLEMILLGMCQKHVQKPSATVVLSRYRPAVWRKCKNTKIPFHQKTKKDEKVVILGILLHSIRL
jgi:hypothetical protein